MAFHKLVIKQVRPEGVNGVALVFDVPDVLASEFAFQAGQYLTLQAEVGGADVRRSYSIATEPDGDLCVGVKQIEGGVFSSFAQRLQAGDHVQVMPPEGRFCLTGEVDVLLVAAGSGITPMIAIAARVLADGGRVTLVYGNRDTAHIMFRDVLARLKDRYLERFTLIHILSREEQDVPLLNGRISEDKIQRMVTAGAIDIDAIQGAYLCGPNAMIDAVSATLTELGMKATTIHTERFLAEGIEPATPSREAVEAAQNGVAVEVIMDGVRKSFMVQEGDGSVLAAAARNGLELPFSCKGGMCCTCRCRVTKGTAEMEVNYSLEPWEIEAGFTLACQARPTSDELVLDFDAM